MENLGRVASPKTTEQSLGGLLPVIVEWSVLIRQVRILQVINKVRILQELGYDGTILLNLIQLFLGNLLVIAVPEHHQRIVLFDFIVLLHLLYVLLLGSRERIENRTLHLDPIALEHLHPYRFITFILVVFFFFIRIWFLKEIL